MQRHGSVLRQRQFISTPEALSVSTINVHWGYDNRTAGLRVPMSSADARRVENRVGGADATVYCDRRVPGCGYSEWSRTCSPVIHYRQRHDLPFGLPRSLDEALRNLRESEPW